MQFNSYFFRWVDSSPTRTGIKQVSGVNDEDAVLTSVRKHLNTASNASSMCLGFFGWSCSSWQRPWGLQVGLEVQMEAIGLGVQGWNSERNFVLGNFYSTLRSRMSRFGLMWNFSSVSNINITWHLHHFFGKLTGVFTGTLLKHDGNNLQVFGITYAWNTPHFGYGYAEDDTTFHHMKPP